MRSRGRGRRRVGRLQPVPGCREGVSHGSHEVRTPPDRLADGPRRPDVVRLPDREDSRGEDRQDATCPREFTKVSMPEYVVEPPDLLLVEVLEALPGRPIQGERLVRPDGKSLARLLRRDLRRRPDDHTRSRRRSSSTSASTSTTRSSASSRSNPRDAQAEVRPTPRTRTGCSST